MNYQEAFKKVLRENELEILNNGFLVRSLLSDYLGGTISELRFLNAYYLLDKQGSLYDAIKNHSLEKTKSNIKLLISKSSPKYTFVEYVKSIEPLLVVIYPDYKRIADPHKKATATRSNQNKNQQVIINKPVQRKVAVDQIVVNAYCSRVVFDFVKSRNIKIFKDTFEVTNNYQLSNNNGLVKIDIKDRIGTFRLQLPKRIYKTIDINTYGASLDLHSTSGYIAKRMKITSTNGLLFIQSGVVDCTIVQKIGDVYHYGKVKNLKVQLGKGSFYSLPSYVDLKTMKVALKKGSIQVNFRSGKIVPKINHLFKKVKNVNGTYQVRNKTIELQLSTSKGKIRVC